MEVAPRIKVGPVSSRFPRMERWGKRKEPVKRIAMEMNEDLKQLMKELGMAINESLSESEPISDAIANIRGAGYDVFLVLEATIGFNKRSEVEEHSISQEEISPRSSNAPSGKLRLTPRDADFLKLLRISLGKDSEN